MPITDTLWNMAKLINALNLCYADLEGLSKLYVENILSWCLGNGGNGFVHAILSASSTVIK